MRRHRHNPAEAHELIGGRTTVSQTAPEHMMNCEPMRVLGKISVYSPAPHHSRMARPPVSGT
jgi:hypothetical protein